MGESFEIIPFHQHHILSVKQDDGVFVVMKPIVEGMGLDWRAQRRRITDHPVLSKGVALTATPSAGGMQEMMALGLEQFHGWLITLDPRRVTDDHVRETIILYQSEAFRAVFEHFHGKIGGAARPVKSTSAVISTQNQIMKLIRRLQTCDHPPERRTLHQMLDSMCQEIGIDTPVLEHLGRDASPVADLLDRFWRAIHTLQDRGHPVNMARKRGFIALCLKDVSRLLEAEKMKLRIDQEMRRALEHSTKPRFITDKSVNCVDGKVRHCWVFERNPAG